MRIEDIDKKIEELQHLKMLCLEPILEADNFDTIIYKKYLELENVKNVAKWLNENGHKKISPSTGKLINYDENDMSARIKDKKADVREELKQVVQKLFIKNKNTKRRH